MRIRQSNKSVSGIRYGWYDKIPINLIFCGEKLAHETKKHNKNHINYKKNIANTSFWWYTENVKYYRRMV